MKSVVLSAAISAATFVLIFQTTIPGADDASASPVLGSPEVPKSTGASEPPSSPTPTPTPDVQSFCDGKTLDDALSALGRGGYYMPYDAANDIYYRSGYHAGKGGTVMGYACYRNPLSDTVLSEDANLAYGLAGYGKWGSAAAAKAFMVTLLASDQEAANSCFICAQDRSTHGQSLGCFPYDVTVAMDDGSTVKKVQDVRVGEHIWNPKLKKPFRVDSIIEGSEKEELVVITAGRFSLKMSTQHPVDTASGMKQAIELVVGDVIQDADGAFHSIEKIVREPLAAGGTVVNFELARSGDKNDGLLVAGGITVGDLIIQRALAAKRKK